MKAIEQKCHRTFFVTHSFFDQFYMVIENQGNVKYTEFGDFAKSYKIKALKQK